MTQVKESEQVKELEEETKESKKLNVGVDVSKDSLDVAFWEEDKAVAVFQGKFTNDKKGFQTIAQKVENRRMAVART